MNEGLLSPKNSVRKLKPSQRIRNIMCKLGMCPYKAMSASEHTYCDNEDETQVPGRWIEDPFPTTSTHPTMHKLDK